MDTLYLLYLSLKEVSFKILVTVLLKLIKSTNSVVTNGTIGHVQKETKMLKKNLLKQITEYEYLSSQLL